MGDFNDFETGILMSSLNVKQVVEKPTRGAAVLDLIITNLWQLYQSPHILAPLGSSDHNIVYWQPSNDRTNKEKSRVKSTKQLIRHYPRSGTDAFGRWASTHDWFGELEPNPAADSLAASFTKDLNEAIDRIFPQKKVSLHRNDKPWITPTIKQLIADRQKAFHSQNVPVWQSLKYKVQEIKYRKKTYYKSEVKHLRKSNVVENFRWWKIVNNIAGKPDNCTSFNFKRDGIILEQSEVVNSLNMFYASVNNDVPIFDITELLTFLPAAEPPPKLEPHEVCRKILSSGPDNIPSRL